MRGKLYWLLLIVTTVGAVASWTKQSATTNVSAAEIGALPGTGALSGKVTAPRPFQAARVYATNLDKGMRYVVFTYRGGYRAVNMLPGTYQVTVKKGGFTAEAQRVVVKAGADATLDFSLRASNPEAIQQAGFVGPPPAIEWDRKNVTLVSYEELYPPGAGRELLQRQCLFCHGLNFLPSRPRSAAQWNAAIAFMSNPNTQRGVQIPPGRLSAEDRSIFDKVAGLQGDWANDDGTHIRVWRLNTAMLYIMVHGDTERRDSIIDAICRAWNEEPST